MAVLDTGIDLAHPDFVNRVAAHESFVPAESVQDERGHGTHCAGVVAGPQSSVGPYAYGVATDVELLIGKVLKGAAAAPTTRSSTRSTGPRTRTRGSSR